VGEDHCQWASLTRNQWFLWSCSSPFCFGMACVCILRIHDAGFLPRRGINSQASASRAARCCDQKGLRTDDTSSPTKQSFSNKNRDHHLWRLCLPAVTLQGQSTKADPTRMCDALIPSSFSHPNRAHKEVG
jgi:hypothetical protein